MYPLHSADQGARYHKDNSQGHWSYAEWQGYRARSRHPSQPSLLHLDMASQEPFACNPFYTSDFENADADWHLSSLSELPFSASDCAEDACSQLQPEPHCVTKDKTQKTAITDKLYSSIAKNPEARQNGEDIEWYNTSHPAEALTRQALLMATPQLDAVFDRGTHTLQTMTAQQVQQCAAKQLTLAPTNNPIVMDQNAGYDSFHSHRDSFTSAMQQCKTIPVDNSAAVWNTHAQNSLPEHAPYQWSQADILHAQLFHQVMTRSSHFHHKFVQAVNLTSPSASSLQRRLAALAQGRDTTGSQQHLYQDMQDLHLAVQAEKACSIEDNWTVKAVQPRTSVLLPWQLSRDTTSLGQMHATAMIHEALMHASANQRRGST